MTRIEPHRLSLYVVTSSGFVSGRGHREVALAAIEGGATAIQLRAPELMDSSLLPLAQELAEACRAADVLFVVNDRVEMAAEAGAGAHVGQSDDPARAREVLEPDSVLGISVATPEEAIAAEAAGADYLGVTVWATPTKADAVPCGLDGLRAVVDATSLPVVGIGGINPGNAGEVLEAGAAGVAVISAVGAGPDMVGATRRLRTIVGER
ncbi:MAG TPA: thiamine phosphate synthase [Actinomycetota bacterium]|nr:thiamine phosphate synthase [Actinomycetota bacterium]